MIRRLILASILMFTLAGAIALEAIPQKLPEGQSCSNTYDTPKDHKCSCMAGMNCPMEKPKPCEDEDCPPPEYGPDSTKCISPFCKKDHCKCANPCES